jgi:hypothetical protein
VASTPTSVYVAGEIMERDGLKVAEGGNIVGREGPRRVVKVLDWVSWALGFQELNVPLGRSL